MAGAGRGAQIIQVTEDHRFELYEKELENVLLREDIKELPVVLISVAGVYRGGKSFLLNFFLRYLISPQAARDDGSWLGEAGQTLEGFSWRSGSTRNTTGILIWSEPIISVLPTGVKVAVLLMDTQGTFDSSSTVNDCSTIFALSTLLSSVQIYNLSQNIQEDHLHHLHLFTEYGKMVRDQGNDKAFQHLMFLVRDWQFSWEHPYGTVGGEPFLQIRLQTNDRMPKELKEVRAHIHSCFEKVSCFLMPHPGFDVCRPDFKGNINQISVDFRNYIKELVSLIFRPEKLQPKLINGKIVKAKELLDYFKSYVNIFASGRIPPTTSIMQATTEAGLLTALREGLAQYEHDMELQCGEKTKCVPAVDIKVLHDLYKAQALDKYKEKKKMGHKKIIKLYYEKLSKDIDNRVEQYAAINAVKQQKVIEAAKEMYDKKVKEVTKSDVLCVHPSDLDAINLTASRFAVTAFHDGRKRITEQEDKEEKIFYKSLDSRYELLKLTNNTNNKQVITDLRNDYWEYMQQWTLADPPLPPSQLQEKHNSGLTLVLETFKTRRNRADAYPEDIYKDELIETLNNRYEQIKEMNKSANKRAINTALNIYNMSVSAVWDQKTKHLHPEELIYEHDMANTKALSSFYPNYQDDDFVCNDDENTLQNILSSRLKELQVTNGSMNKEAIQSAYNVYKDRLAELRRPHWSWIFIIPMLVSIIKDSKGEYHTESKTKAKTEFYKKRKNKGTESTDVYLQTLYEKIGKNNRILKK